MNKKNKNGFTLVELLAVIVIIGILLVIVFNVVNNQIKKADYNSTKINADVYVKEVNNQAAVSRMETTKISAGKYSVNDLTELGVKVNGKSPDEGYLYLQNYKVVSGCLSYDKFYVNIEDGKATTTKKGKCEDTSLAFDFDVNGDSNDSQSGSSQKFVAPETGKYKLEVWGAQGGSAINGSTALGGYGAYSVMNVRLKKDDVLFVTVGKKGTDGSSFNATFAGGYNGGGSAISDGATIWGAGGGATSIATKSGEIKSLSKEDLVLVAGGGGGAGRYNVNRLGGYGGGCIGSDGSGTYGGRGGTETAGGEGRGSASYHSDGSYGQGGNAATFGSGGGGGLYGGGTGYDSGSAAGGGSGYINKNYPGFISGEFYSYSNSSSSNECSTKNPLGFNGTPTSKSMKSGNGYAKITLE